MVEPKLIFDDKLEMPPGRIFERVRSISIYPKGVEHYPPGRDQPTGRIDISTKSGDLLGQIHYISDPLETPIQATLDDRENPQKEKFLREIVHYILIEAWDRTRADRWLAESEAGKEKEKQEV